MNKYAYLIVCAFLYCHCLQAQTKIPEPLKIGADTALTQLISANHHLLRLNRDSLEGNGGVILYEALKNSQFFMIGEEHGIAEVPQLVYALFKEAKKYGYHHVAIETDPFAASLLEEKASYENAAQILEDYHKNHPLEIPFFSLIEESEFLQKVVEEEDRGVVSLWGLDQVFVLGARSLLKKLGQMPISLEAREIVQDLYSKAQSGYRETVQNGDFTKLFMFDVSPEEMESLKVALGKSAPPLATKIVEELATSSQIYQLYAQGISGNYASNVQREQLMKKHFVEHYNDAVSKGESLPKAILKFGASHLYRGQKPDTKAYSLGNFISEFATANGEDSYNVMVIGGKDSYMAYIQQHNFTYGNILASMCQKDWLKPFVKASGKKYWSLFELYPLKVAHYNGELKNIHPQLEKLIWSYDALVILNGSKAAGYK